MRSREEIQARAADDPAFRDQLKADPRGTVERELGGNLPENVQIQVLEETMDQVYLVIPTAPSAQMSDAELASTAGGGCWIGASQNCSFVTTTG